MLHIIKDRTEILQLLGTLDQEKKPVFGKMTAQHMIEHLIVCVTWSNGGNPQECYNMTRDSEKMKSILVYSDREMAPGFKNPIFPVDPPPLVCSTINEAIEDMRTELEEFDRYYREHEYGKQTDPAAGELVYSEWVIMHSKHFRHHMRQFELI